tara:strand:- start:67 stop:312 length:246 start_codon:yes stop_codon:yes gene_type:complete
LYRLAGVEQVGSYCIIYWLSAKDINGMKKYNHHAFLVVKELSYLKKRYSTNLVGSKRKEKEKQKTNQPTKQSILEKRKRKN